MARGINTKCLHLEEEEGCCNNYGSISFPIYQTATYEHPAVGQSTGFDYSRLQNPTREHLEKIVATLENGIDALAFSTGMAAITLVMELFKPGDHLIIDADLYGGSIRLFDNVSSKNGIHFSRIDCWKENVESYVNENTKAIYIETPTNPMMNVTDIAALAEIARRHNLLLIVDNTFLSPYFQNPLELGADIVVHSGTKFLGGHKQARGFGSMLTIQLESREFALSVLEKVRMIKFAESLGGVETLITYPTTQTHADVPKEIRERNGITEATLRLSVGIEDTQDLLDEFEKVFAETEEELHGGKKS